MQTSDATTYSSAARGLKTAGHSLELLKSEEQKRLIVIVCFEGWRQQVAANYNTANLISHLKKSSSKGCNELRAQL